MKSDLNRMIDPAPVNKRLAPAETPQAIRGKVGLERKGAGDVKTEEVDVESTDGLFTFTVRVISG